MRLAGWTFALVVAGGALGVGACDSGTKGSDGAAGQIGSSDSGTAGTGGTGTGGAAGTGGGGQGGTGGSGGSSGCAGAVAMAACTNEGLSCSDHCTGACSFCNILRCMNGKWQPIEAAPAPCFSCGSNLRCQINAEYCEAFSGGPAGTPITYQCHPLPSACRTTPTCSCLQTQIVGGSCQQTGAGQLTLTLAAP